MGVTWREVAPSRGDKGLAPGPRSHVHTGYVTLERSPSTRRGKPVVKCPHPAPSAVCADNDVHGQLGEIAVVDAPVVDLVRELVKQSGPVPPRRLDRHGQMDGTLDELDR